MAPATGSAALPSIAILGGTGNEGSGLALRWAHAGYRVIIGSRNAEKAAQLCTRINERVAATPVSHASNRDAAAAGQIVVLSVPYAAQRSTVEEVRDALEGKILIDTTVPLVPPKVARVQLPEAGSAVAAIQRLLGESVKVVSAFQNVPAHLLQELGHEVDCDVLVCGDDVQARETVIALATDIGLRALHAGPIANSAAAEALTSILISINSRYKVSGAGIRITGLDNPQTLAVAAVRPTEPGLDTAVVRRELRLIALGGVPLVRPGHDLCETILNAVARSGEELRSGDVLVLAQKIVSKAQGRFVDLDQVTPSPRALELAKVAEKDPRVIELILRESSEVLRVRRDVLVVVHRLGFVMANAGIDFSNVDAEQEDSRVLLLPADPDGECGRLRAALLERVGASIAVIINDSHGRAWRNGTVGVAIGVSGIPALLDLRGKPDLFGRALRITQVGLADELAAAASLLMGQADEGTPIVLVRGLSYAQQGSRAAELVRPKELDLFR